MKPAAFRYPAPKTIEEAGETLAEVASEDGRVLAGGQSLVPIMAFRLARPGHLVDINGIEALRRLAVEGERLCIGACVRHAAFHHPVADGPLGRLLATVVRHIAHYPIRTRGTFCGSIAHADPAAEWCLVAAALEAERGARSATGTVPRGAREEGGAWARSRPPSANAAAASTASWRAKWAQADERWQQHQMDRAIGQAAGGSSAGQGPRPLRRRHCVPAPAAHADRSRKPRPRQDPCD